MFAFYIHIVQKVSQVITIFNINLQRNNVLKKGYASNMVHLSSFQHIVVQIFAHFKLILKV